MFQHNTNYINAINTLRASTGANPEHNRHLSHIAQAMQDAFAANNLQYDAELWELRQTVKQQQE